MFLLYLLSSFGNLDASQGLLTDILQIHVFALISGMFHPSKCLHGLSSNISTLLYVLFLSHFLLPTLHINRVHILLLLLC